MKLGPHIIGSGSRAGARLGLEGKVPAVKLVDAHNQGDQFRAAGVPIVIARATIGGDEQWRRWVNDPAGYYATHLRGHLTHPANAAVTHWETGVNEDHRKLPGQEATDPADVAMRAAFEAAVAAAIALDGRRPVVGHWAVGNPSGTRTEQKRAWYAYAPALRAAAVHGGLVGLHGYYTVGGWEQALDTLLEVLDDLGLTDLPVVLNEAGADLPAWKVRGLSEAAYGDQLLAFDQALTAKYGGRVVAALLYTYGGGAEWRDHSLDDALALTERLIQYGRTGAGGAPPPAPVPAAPQFVNPGFEAEPLGVGWEPFVVRNSGGEPWKNLTFRIEQAARGASPLSRRGGNNGGQLYGEYICWRAGVRQRVAVTPGRRYRLGYFGRAWMRPDGRFDLPSAPLDGVDAVTQFLCLTVRGVGGLLAHHELVDKTGAWHALEVEVVADGAHLTVEAEADLGGPQSRWPYEKSAFSFDDFWITEILTPAPPAEPPPTPTPAYKKVEVINPAGGLNVRRGPSTLYQPVGFLVTGSALPVLEVHANGWIRITPTGWISGGAKFVRLT